jgi:hypothetical protein
MRALTRFWSQDQGLSAVLALLIISIFVLPPFIPPGSGRSALGDTFFALLLIAGVRALFKWKFARWALMPVAALLFAEVVTGALTSKYTIALVPGIAILAGYLLAYAEVAMRAAVAAVVAVLAVFGLWVHVVTALSYRGSEPVDAQALRVLQGWSLPVAFDSPHQFLEFVHYEPQLAATGRLVYPMDAATAREVRGFDNDEIALRGLSRIRPLDVLGYREFTDRNGQFLVVYSQAFWPGLVTLLKRDGYCLRLLERSGSTSVMLAFPGCPPVRD